MEKRIEAGWLLGFYGPLLTPRQQELMALYCEEDMSLAEIAQQEQISRQGVHDTVQRTQRQLQEYENRLGLLARFQVLERALEDCRREIARLPQDVRDTAPIQSVMKTLTGLLTDEEGYRGL